MRLMADFNQSLDRLQNCLLQQSTEPQVALSTLASLKTEAQAMRPKLQPRTLRQDPELLRSGMELIYKIEQATGGSCGEPQGLYRALLLIGRKHQGALQ